MKEFVFKPPNTEPPSSPSSTRMPLRVDTNGRAGSVSGMASAVAPAGMRSSQEPQTAVLRSARPWESEPAGDYEWSLDNNLPYSHVTRVVSDFLFEQVSNAPQAYFEVGELEIEARLGHLVDVETYERCSIPIRTEAVIAPEAVKKHRFENWMDGVSN
jgi:hypothetical protein